MKPKTKKKNRRCAGSSKKPDCNNEAEFDSPGEQCPWCHHADRCDDKECCP